MTTEELQQKLEELQNKFEEYIKKSETKDKDFANFKLEYGKHEHSSKDGTQILTQELNLSPETPIKMGYGGLITTTNAKVGTTEEQLQLSLVSGKDMGGAVGTTTNNLQLNLLHQPQNASNQSFITAFRPPLYTTVSDSTVSVTLAGNTITISGYNFVVNSLAGALINIFNSSGTLIENRTIASNTSTVITITGTWGASTSGGTFVIYVPVFMGSADTIFQRFYTQEGTVGGVRFGVGVTAGAQNQNGLLYMDATGDLYWRGKTGISTKLN